MKGTKHLLIQFIMQKACLSKKNLTKEAADRLVDFFAGEGKLMYYYKCEFCSSYHMTSRPGEVKKNLVVA